MFKIGDKVKVSSDNDNSSYEEFRERELVVVAEYYSDEEDPFYDESMEGMGLYELEDEEGMLIDCALYSYELEYA